jgi:WD40 repeat protein
MACDARVSLTDEPAPKRIKLEASGDAEDGLTTPLTALPAALSPLAHYGQAKTPRFEPIYTLQGHTKGATTVAFSPDGRQLVTAGVRSAMRRRGSRMTGT